MWSVGLAPFTVILTPRQLFEIFLSPMPWKTVYLYRQIWSRSHRHV